MRFGDSALDRMADAVIPEEHFEFAAAYVRDAFFHDDRMLRIKQRVFEQHRVAGISLRDHLLDCLDLRGDECVLDLGCGNGVQLRMVADRLSSGRLVGLDIAPGVLDAASETLRGSRIPVELVESSADDLGLFGDASFDRVMANYMMHYVPDIDLCFREVRRVLRTGGRFLVTTNSTRSMVEMYQIHFNALRAIGAPQRLFKAGPKGRLSVDNGPDWLRRYFGNVTLRMRPDVMAFSSVEPFLEFYQVGHNYCCAASESAADLDEGFFARLAEAVGASVQEVVDREGRFTVTKLTGTIVCS